MPWMETVSRLTDAQVRARGDSYFEQGRVSGLEVDDTTITADVQGTRNYRVIVTVEAGGFHLVCSCGYVAQYEDTCKHIWAVFREMDRRDLFPDMLVRYVDVARAFVDDEFEEPRTVDSSRAPWRKFFASIQPVHRFTPAHSTRPAPEELIYAIEVWGTQIVQPQLRLSILGRSRRKNGEWGKYQTAYLQASHLETLPELDREIITLLNAQSLVYPGRLESSYLLRLGVADLFVPRLSRGERLYMRRTSGSVVGPLKWDDSGSWSVKIAVEHDQSGGVYRMEGWFERDGTRRPLSEASLVVSGFVAFDSTLAPLDKNEALSWIDPLRQTARVEIPEADGTQFVAALLEAPPANIALPPDLQWHVEAQKPVPVLKLRGVPSTAELLGGVFFRYGEHELEARSPGRQWMDANRKVVRRDPDSEREWLAQIDRLPFIRDYYGAIRLRGPTTPGVLQKLLASGWSIELEGGAVRAAGELDLSVSSGIDWFDVSGGVSFGDERIELPKLLAAVAGHQLLIPLADGSMGLVPAAELERFSVAGSLGKEVEGGIRFRKTQALLIDALLGSRGQVSFDASFAALRQKLAEASIHAAHEGPGFHGELRHYQREGLGWLRFLGEVGLGGCLADDMGLGKTIQVLALLDQIHGKKGKPSLVVAPRSLLFNWKTEAARFAPNLRVIEHHGASRLETSEHFEDYDLVLTTYGTLRMDALLLARHEFRYAILDESQAIKNASSQSSKAVRLLQAEHRLALSGTPIENHIGELWSLFEFLNPGMLGTSRFFSRTFAAKTVPPERRQLLARAVRPFILRRTKEQVAPELPERVEQTLYCELEKPQRTEYDALREHYRSSLLQRVKQDGMSRSKMHVLEALLRLRQAACHPGLIDPSSDAGSAKLDVLMEEVSEVMESGHKALVFSQFTSFLAFVRKRLDAGRIEYSYLDGQTTNRQKVVDRFQSDDGPPLFLISLKAGGLGLNLTRADYVFLLDPWWNPAVEAQAIDRSHRIGQSKPVFAYRLIARDTVEEKILDLQAAKRSLAQSVITDENSILQKLDVEDLEQLLS